MREKISLDDIIVNLAYFYISGALILMQTMFRAAKSLKLGGDDYTKEQKRSLKEDLNFTYESVQALTNAQKAYKDCIRNLEIVAKAYDKTLISGAFDRGMANVNALLSYDIMYCHKTDGDNEAETDLHRYQAEYKETSDDVRRVCEKLMSNSKRLRNGGQAHI